MYVFKILLYITHFLDMDYVKFFSFIQEGTIIRTERRALKGSVDIWNYTKNSNKLILTLWSTLMKKIGTYLKKEKKTMINKS